MHSRRSNDRRYVVPHEKRPFGGAHLSAAGGLCDWPWDNGRLTEPALPTGAELGLAHRSRRAGTAVDHPAADPVCDDDGDSAGLVPVVFSVTAGCGSGIVRSTVTGFPLADSD